MGCFEYGLCPSINIRQMPVHANRRTGEWCRSQISIAISRSLHASFRLVHFNSSLPFSKCLGRRDVGCYDIRINMFSRFSCILTPFCPNRKNRVALRRDYDAVSISSSDYHWSWATIKFECNASPSSFIYCKSERPAQIKYQTSFGATSLRITGPQSFSGLAA